MKKAAEYIGMAIIVLSLVGCASSKFDLGTKKEDFTNLEIIEVSSQKGTTFDMDESGLLADQLGQYTFKRKGNKKDDEGIYLVNVLKGTSQVESFQIIDEYSIVYKDRLYKSNQAIELHNIDELIDKERAIEAGVLEEETYKLAHSDVCIFVYTSKATECDDKKIEYVMVANKGQSTAYQNIDAYFDKLLWIDNEKKAVLSYYGDGWHNFMIIDLETGQLLYGGDINCDLINKENGELSNGIEMEESLYLNYQDISDDGNKVRMNYSLVDEDGDERNGSIWYDLTTKKLSEAIYE